MKSPLQSILAAIILVGLVTGFGHAATFEDDVQFRDVELGARFVSRSTDKAATLVDHKRGYASIQYKIGEKADRDYLRKAISAFVQTLPKKFGDSEGTYTISIIVKDATGKELVKEPILNFQWTKKQAFLIIEKVVEQLQATNWSGSLINDVLVADGTGHYEVGVEVFQSSSRAMDFESLKKTSQLFTEGALSMFLPLPGAATGLITAVGDVIDLFYSGSTKATLAEFEQVAVTSMPHTHMWAIKFKQETNGQEIPWTLPIQITVSSRPSRFMSGAFNPANVSVAMADEKTFTIVTAKAQPYKASLLDLIRGSDAHPEVRGFLDAIAAKRNDEGETDSNCGALYSAIGNYLSIYDARALFWAFVRRHGALVEKTACLSGGRREELEQIGLLP